LNPTTNDIVSTPLPARAHEVIVHPRKPILAVVSRRPGFYLTLMDSDTGKALRTINSEPGYHFFGHGIFTRDGRYLITTENKISSGQGYIVIRDISADYHVVANYASNGIGPHQIKLSLDEATLIVANGGILTHPDRGREKLNLETMSPSLDYLELHSGKVLESHKLPADLHQLSIRHIDLNQSGQLVIAMQYQGEQHDNVPLIALHSRTNPVELLRAPDDINLKMKQYCGSVCFDESGKYFAVSSPKGNLITFWSAMSKQFIGASRCRDGCGISPIGKAKFAVSNGAGELYHYEISSTHENIKKQRVLSNKSNELAFDNHLSLL